MHIFGILRTALAVACAVVATAAVSAPTRAEPPEANPFSQPQTMAIERIIRDYMMQHPEILLDVQSELEAKAEARRIGTIQKTLHDHKDAIYHDPESPFAGNPNGDVIVVEFLDYNCPYCRKGSGDIAKLIASDPNVKVVFQEYPNLSPTSEPVALIAVAAKRQGKYYQLHRALLDLKGPTTAARAIDVAGKLGLDVARLQLDAELPEVRKVVERSRAVAAKLGLEGTPMFLIGDHYIQGVPDNFYNELTKLVGEVRKTGCMVC